MSFYSKVLQSAQNIPITNSATIQAFLLENLEPNDYTKHMRHLTPYSLLNTANQGTVTIHGVQRIVSRKIFFLSLPEPLKVFNNVIEQTLFLKGPGTLM